MKIHASTKSEQGQAMMLVIGITALLSVLAIAMIGVIISENTRSAHAVTLQTAFQAAEAGIDNYTSKLVEDHLYYAHYVGAAEATRRSSGGTLVSAGSPWSYDLNWTYPKGHDTWQPLSNNYEYNLEIIPPSATSTNSISILATGRPTGDTNTADWRSVQTLVRPASLADFMMFSDQSVSYGSTATTNGNIYSNGSVTHDGTASKNIYGYGGVSGSVNLQNGAKTYSGSAAVKGAIPDAPINFSSFLGSLIDVQSASQSGGVYLNNTGVAAWQVTFQSNGTFTVQSCSPATGQSDVAAASPKCGSATTYTVPSNGAIYSPQTVILSGQVHGRVTVASNNNIDIGGNISYVTPGQDVLGMIAANDVVICHWVPNDLTWTGASLAQSGSWRSYNSDGSHGTMTYSGATATKLGGYMTMFNTRIYTYDPNLLYLPPPWFPTLEQTYTTLLFRQVPPTP